MINPNGYPQAIWRAGRWDELLRLPDPRQAFALSRGCLLWLADAPAQTGASPCSTTGIALEVRTLRPLQPSEPGLRSCRGRWQPGLSLATCPVRPSDLRVFQWTATSIHVDRVTHAGNDREVPIERAPIAWPDGDPAAQDQRRFFPQEVCLRSMIVKTARLSCVCRVHGRETARRCWVYRRQTARQRMAMSS
jgi:hypothetical protein